MIEELITNCWRKPLGLLLFLGLATTAAPVQARAQESGGATSIRIALLEDGPSADESFDLEYLRLAIAERLGESFDARFPIELHAVGDWTESGIRAEFDRLLRREDLSLLIAVGPIGSHLLVQAGGLPHPSIAMRVLDAEYQRAPFGGLGSGVRNLNYLSAPLKLASDVAGFSELVSIDRVALLVNAEHGTVFSELFSRVQAELELAEIESRVVIAGGSPEAILEQLDDPLESVFVFPLPQLAIGEFETLAAGLAVRKQAAFSMLSAEDVRHGLLACIAPEISFQALARQVAQNVVQILEGELPENVSTSLPGSDQLSINQGTAFMLDLKPRFDVLVEAELVGPVQLTLEPTLSLSMVMSESLAVDQNLQAAEQSLLSQLENLAESRASLLPQIDLAAAWTVIDEEQATLGRAESSLLGRVAGTQVLYSEGLLAQLGIEEELQAARESDVEVLRLDVVQAAANAYLNVLRARSSERVRRDDLRLTRSNLELAQVRRSIGVSGPAEVYRWESRIATSRGELLRARADVRIAEIELNRVLHRPLDQAILIEEVELASPGMLRDERLVRFVENPWDFQVFRDFQVREGLQLSPELASLESALRGQERALTSARRAHWQPVFWVDGSLTDVFDAGGTGSQIPPGFAGVIPDPEITTWSASLLASFPLFTGGAKQSRERRARYELVRLRYQREALEQLVEQRIRASLEVALASFARIRLSGQAAEAAQKSLELITDSYSNGQGSIFGLLQAQNAALIARESEVGALYEFALDLIAIQRAVGHYDIFFSEALRDRWFEDLERFERSHSPQSVR